MRSLRIASFERGENPDRGVKEAETGEEFGVEVASVYINDRLTLTYTKWISQLAYELGFHTVGKKRERMSWRSADEERLRFLNI